jgi:hypothetical protein
VPLEEGLGARLGGVPEHLVKRALLVDHALGDEEHAIGHLVGKAQLVHHEQHGAPSLGERADHAQHLAHELGAERRHVREEVEQG